MNWLLPEYIADALPPESARIETLRRRIVDLFVAHGYELVMPPLLEYLESLLTGAGQELSLRTLKLADQLSGRTLGIRADMTPQVARIDAHLLNRAGVTRLCYCGSTLHARPASLVSSREPIQIGAELYGYAGTSADGEILRLLAAALQASELPGFRLDLGHVGIFRALADAARTDAETGEEIFTLLQNKDVPALAALCATLPSPYGEAILALSRLYGDDGVLAEARRVLPPLPEIAAALDTLARLTEQMRAFTVCIDLADLRGYHYHNGAVFAAYVPGYPAAIALGGRYDGVGKSFGRARPATGFSLDLRELARLSNAATRQGAILAPAVPDTPDDPELARRLGERIAALRAAGEIVIERLPEENTPADPRCDRKLALQGRDWILQANEA
ncbi:MAG: ATP phosphoribosyltransferase regulatory subunit [Zoogloeaceae bacterium]|jgi:ATP phosphoribosyltransferase regulatory subunit|nr:ATP phosphoribosyltransferase regulatory subunit [Zoogloeaceae bacterium]